MSLLGGAQVVFFFFWENMHKYVIQQRYSKVVFFSSRIASFYKYINMINGYGKDTLLFKNYYSPSGFNEPILNFIAALSLKIETAMVQVYISRFRIFKKTFSIKLS